MISTAPELWRVEEMDLPNIFLVMRWADEQIFAPAHGRHASERRPKDIHANPGKLDAQRLILRLGSSLERLHFPLRLCNSHHRACRDSPCALSLLD
jgi:hypothetical protein